MMQDLTGNVAWVTGGGSGVGAVLALALAEAGASVMISGRRQEPLLEVAAQHQNIATFAFDVTQREQVDDCARQIEQRFGALDIVVANAGSANSAPFARTTESDLQALWAVNVLGVFNVWQSALPLVKQSAHGRLLVLASIAGLQGAPYVSAYCAAKHGVVGMMKSVALELAKSTVTVNALCPSYINTPMLDRTIENIMQKTGCSKEEAENVLKKNNPQGRFIEPEEVASTLLWLCQERAQSITGQTISISGGEV